MTLLALDSVSKSFGGVTAVAGLSLSVAPGRITGLIGPNGAGKTTVLNLITGMHRATAGTIRFRGADVTALAPHRRARAGMGRTFQNIRLLNEASVLDNVVIGFHRHETTSLLANLLGLPAAGRERRRLTGEAQALLERFGMAHFARQPAGSLSYGHQRRLEIIRALATGPDLLLLDEPVAGMNDVEAEELAAILRQIAAGGPGLLVIEHNMRFVMALCEVVHVLDAGRLIASGPPAAVYDDPQVVAAYVGD